MNTVKLYISRKSAGPAGIPGISIVPHIQPFYKSISKQFKRETGQMFFRDNIDGQIKLYKSDYDFINETSIDDTLILSIYRNDEFFAMAEFNKTDCKFDRFKKCVELKLSPIDKYTDILNKYKNTYDLIKCATATTPLTMMKRCIVQIYIQGEKVVSNYSGGTHWETEVTEVIDDEDTLLRKYYFWPGPAFREINLVGFNYDINAAYRCIKTKNIWNAESSVTIDGKVYKLPCSIRFTKIYNANEQVDTQDINSIFKLSDGKTTAVRIYDAGFGLAMYDSYRIEICDAADGKGTVLYRSKSLFGADDQFNITSGEGLYFMQRVSLPSPLKQPTPESFYLGEYIIEYNTWIRLLCDVDKVGEEGQSTYDLPYDDFTAERGNYKKCIGLSVTSEGQHVINIVQNSATSDTPTAYGQNDFGKYFTSPYNPLADLHGYLPLAKSTWGNTSLWVYLDNDWLRGSFEAWCSKTYKKYILKDSYHIADVIKTLLQQIDPTITHEATPEYSQFLYGSSLVVSNFALDRNQLYITQKTNVLKGEYDQAAQKAEISLKDVMDMLKECFRCYWYIDNNNRFIIEHEYFFLHGYSYTGDSNMTNLVPLLDKFNKKPILYCQQELEYNKQELRSRYEFSWMDDVTDAMGNVSINFNNAYISGCDSESVSISHFCPDVDYMLFKPGNFSNDGFALLAARNHEVQIVTQTIYDPKQNGAPLYMYTLNGILSWRMLIHHRMYNAPSRQLSLDNLEGPNIWDVANIQRILKHNIQVQLENILDVTQLVVTDIGEGYIEELSIDADTNVTKLTLSYEPS